MKVLESDVYTERCFDFMERRTMASSAGRRALVTGATRGLGLEIARGLHAAGAVVYVNGRDGDILETVCREMGDGALPLPFDITDSDAREAAFARMAGADGAPDILVNCVGIRDRRDAFAFADADLRAMLDSNLIAPFDLCRRAAQGMMAQGWGRIVNVTSIAGHVARPGDAAYTAAKAGLTGLTRAFAAEFGPHGVTVNAIAPGFFATETNAAMVDDPETLAFVRSRASLQRWGRPEEIAGPAVFLCSEAASYVTGHVLFVDGGMTAHF